MGIRVKGILIDFKNVNHYHMRGYGAGIDPFTQGHFSFRDKICMFIGDYDMLPVKI